MRQLLLLFLFSLLLTPAVLSQQLTREEALDSVLPSFSIYQDNYFITGIPTHTGINDETADVKYQISFKQLITRHTLPFETQLFLTYTQKAFWNIYQFSSPFQEVNFNPGIGLGKPIFNRNDKYVGVAELMVEHESNGRDSIYSRSWNHISLGYHTRLTKTTRLSLKAWIPFAYKNGNRDLLKYLGYGEINLAMDLDDDWILSINARKGNEWDWKGRLRTRLQYRLSKDTNQYLMLEWFTGYGESLIDYDRHSSMIRVGYVIKSPDLMGL